MKVLATLAFLLIALGSTWSYPQNFNDYPMDEGGVNYDYTDDGDHEEEVDYSDLQLPTFDVQEQTYTVVEGGDIEISCAVSGKTPYVPIVKKVGGSAEKEQLLFVGDVKVSIKNKFTINNGIVTIKNVNRNDAGDYMCYFETEPVVELIHKLDVQYAPKISSQTPKNQRVIKGSSVTLECEATGNPIPRITWSRADGHMPAGSQEEEGRAMTLLDVDRHVEGTYTCKANNSIGAPATRDMSITVEYAPEIVTEKAIVRTGEGDKVELVCIVHARPTAEVTWMKDGSSTEHAPNMEESEGGHRHTLMLEKVSEEMFGDYTCSAQNDNGNTEATIHLTDLPKAPHFTSSPNGGEETSYTLTFETESYYPITEYTLKYRKAKANDSAEEPGNWTELEHKDVGDIDTKEMTHSLKYTLEELEQATEYEVVVAVKNQNKWGNEATFLFSTKKDKAQSHIGRTTSGSSSLLGTYTSMLVIAAAVLLNH